MNAPEAVTIYTRGIATPGGGAYGVLLVCEGHDKELSGGEPGASNNRMDVLAAVEALKALKRPCRVTLYNTLPRCRFAAAAIILKRPCRVTLYNTNGYLIDAMAKGWAVRWRDAGWLTGEGRPTAHADLWDALLELCAVHEVEFVWLPAEGIGEYARCQRLARQVIEEQVRRVAQRRAEQNAAADRPRE